MWYAFSTVRVVAVKKSAVACKYSAADAFLENTKNLFTSQNPKQMFETRE